MTAVGLSLIKTNGAACLSSNCTCFSLLLYYLHTFLPPVMSSVHAPSTQSLSIEMLGHNQMSVPPKTMQGSPSPLSQVINLLWAFQLSLVALLSLKSSSLQVDGMLLEGRESTDSSLGITENITLLSTCSRVLRNCWFNWTEFLNNLFGRCTKVSSQNSAFTYKGSS